MSKLQMRYHMSGFQYYVNFSDVIALLVHQKDLEEFAGGKKALEETLVKLREWKADITAPSKETLADQARRRETAQVGKNRTLTDAERAKGRGEDYYSLSPAEQWGQDKRLGILDWNGK